MQDDLGAKVYAIRVRNPVGMLREMENDRWDIEVGEKLQRGTSRVSRYSDRVACTETRKFRHSNNDPESRSSFQYHRCRRNHHIYKEDAQITMLFSFVSSHRLFFILSYRSCSFRAFSSAHILHRGRFILMIRVTTNRECSERTEPGLAICCVSIIARVSAFPFASQRGG